MGAMYSFFPWLGVPKSRREVVSISGTAHSSQSSVIVRYAQRSDMFLSLYSIPVRSFITAALTILMADPNWNHRFYYDVVHFDAYEPLRNGNNNLPRGLKIEHPLWLETAEIVRGSGTAYPCVIFS